MSDNRTVGRRWSTVAKTLWITVSVIVLAVTIFDSAAPGNRDNDIVMIWLMLLLSFPSAYAAALAMYEMSRLSHGTLPGALGHYPAFLANWLAFFIVGYLQWFVLVPALVRRYVTPRFNPRV